jgi:serralysin
MDGDTRGGNDTLIAGPGLSVAGSVPVNALMGDAFEMHDDARGGNDILVSGPGTDNMWGDAAIINGVAASPTAPTGSVVTGADTFVFAPGSGNDDINDFRQSDHDRIDVRAYGFHSIADMTITADGGGNTRIAFDANDGVTLVGIADPHGLHPSDFLLA